jgi:hypothetical protein
MLAGIRLGKLELSILVSISKIKLKFNILFGANLESKLGLESNQNLVPFICGTKGNLIFLG